VSGAALVFAALGDPTRLALLAQLSAEESASIARLTQGTDVTRQAITRHLEVLEGAGLARSTKSGRERVWRLERARLELAKRSLDQIGHWWDDKLMEFKASIEK
jgi:DNA-binding transcriptional ArsR family regulator